jgi:large subunit ribosomal protein L25
MKNIAVNVNARQEMTKNELRRFRNEGYVPAILYGKHIKNSISVSLNARELLKIINSHGSSVILSFKSEDKKLDGTNAIIKSVQKDPVKETFLNVDLIEIRKDEKITINIPITYVGTPKGVKDGGVVDIKKRNLEIECLPNDIPQDIKIDVSGLELNQVLHVSDIKVEGGIEILDAAEVTLISVSIVREKVVEAPAEGAVTAEPEVIGKTAKAEPEAEETKDVKKEPKKEAKKD